MNETQKAGFVRYMNGKHYDRTEIQFIICAIERLQGMGLSDNDILKSDTRNLAGMLDPRGGKLVRRSQKHRRTGINRYIDYLLSQQEAET